MTPASGCFWILPSRPVKRVGTFLYNTKKKYLGPEQTFVKERFCEKSSRHLTFNYFQTQPLAYVLQKKCS